MEYTTMKATDKKLIDALYPYLINDKCCVAGGFFKDYYSGKKIKDIDIFCEDDITAKEIKTIFSHAYKKDFESDTVSRYHDKRTQIDLVTKIQGKPDEIIKHFDFTICQFACYRKGNDFYIIYCNAFFSDLHSKAISTLGCSMDYPVSTLKRLIRYVTYGFSPTGDTLMSIAREINLLDEEQLAIDFYNSEFASNLF